MRRSAKVALVLLGTAGVVGVATAVDAWWKARASDAADAAPIAPPVPITAAQSYANNDYIPGVGYYHAPYRAWYPFPFNYHDPARGYFGGGLWQAAPFALALMRSQPTNDAVTAAVAAQQARIAREQAERQAQAQSRSSFFGGFRSSGSSGFSSSRSGSSTPSSTGSHSSIMRGGFGSSGHSSGGAS